MPTLNDNKTQLTKEDILTDALPYIQRYEGKTFVIKYGGAAMTDAHLKESFAKDVTLLKKIGINVVIVHGGGKEVTELSSRLSSICRHQSSSAWRLAARPCAYHDAIRSASTEPASPTMPMSTRTFLLMELASISIWTFLEFGEKASSRPVTRSSNRAPTQTMTSQSCMALLAS